ncbi:DUF1611 domain-containing protein [Desulfococcus multivorans]|uniref:DUF1611 domain-containing protein n=1 Tax=Desulfococcus multivorans DSM 2059 TaxID=1121405 RepID=S7TPZ0_DESML|nr:DUF1611 domain-containing protein [Desulfococcus multivorans]AOY57557.1 conserved uncharacterized protein [Desulfococcus multivorans]AQU99973.1 hypothetical protein B2D07_03745 [Desulfococcus multivorans]EPR39267.1 protein of unknown function DUF1611 [Desulfococcus multivorans DSM 2059]SKA11801.1 Uncharacterized conserved protein, NAD-dependent epimerase/dehydratase family [Desulfococcus multivorans DSM 2059]
MHPEGNAIVYCEGAFNTPNGKTAHGLVRFTRRYRILSVVDSRHAGEDAGLILDGKPNGIPVSASLAAAVEAASQGAYPPTHCVIGIAPDGGRLSPAARADVVRAVEMGLNVDCGLHDFLSDDAAIRALAAEKGMTIRDIRKPPPRASLHFFSGSIESVEAFRIAVLGTDSAVGKRTTAWILVQAFEALGCRAELVGTGQTAWMQGARYTLVMDALVNDFVSGEIEHAVVRAWTETRPDVIVIEGQGSLMNPAYPGGFEILAAGRPDVVVLQHAPARRDYDGFPGYPIQPLSHQIQAIQILSGRPIAAVTLNHEDLPAETIPTVCAAICRDVGVPAYDVLRNGGTELAKRLMPFIRDRKLLKEVWTAPSYPFCPPI